MTDVRVTFTPTLREHFRATSELGRVARTYDPAATFPLFFALVALNGALSR